MGTSINARRATVQASRAGRTGVRASRDGMRTSILASKSRTVGTTSTINARVDSVAHVAIMWTVVGGSTGIVGVVVHTGA